MLSTAEQGIYKIHPCLEINLRMNIGILAINVQQRLQQRAKGTTSLLPSDDRKFSATVDNGRLFIGLKEQLEAQL